MKPEKNTYTVVVNEKVVSSFQRDVNTLADAMAFSDVDPDGFDEALYAINGPEDYIEEVQVAATRQLLAFIDFDAE